MSADWANVIINGLVAIGTIGAVLVALFHEQISLRLLSPKLQFLIDNIPWKSRVAGDDHVSLCYLTVQNLKPHFPARNVRVVLSHVQHFRDDAWINLPLAYPLYAVWSSEGSPPIRTVSHEQEVLDLGRVTYDELEGPVFAPCLYSVPTGEALDVQQGQMARFTFRALADNVREGPSICLEVDFRSFQNRRPALTATRSSGSPRGSKSQVGV